MKNYLFLRAFSKRPCSSSSWANRFPKALGPPSGGQDGRPLPPLPPLPPGPPRILPRPSPHPPPGGGAWSLPHSPSGHPGDPPQGRGGGVPGPRRPTPSPGSGGGRGGGAFGPGGGGAPGAFPEPPCGPGAHRGLLGGGLGGGPLHRAGARGRAPGSLRPPLFAFLGGFSPPPSSGAWPKAPGGPK